MLPVIAGGLLSACSSSKPARTATPTLPTSSDPQHPRPSKSQAASPRRWRPRITSALHNVHAVNQRLISGGVPEGDAAFDELEGDGDQRR